MDNPEAKKPEVFYCATCKEYKSIGNDSEVMRQVIDFRKLTDGKVLFLEAKDAKRFAIFCKKCQKFFGIVDPEARAAFDKLIKEHQK